jgi:hypothetical protein
MGHNFHSGNSLAPNGAIVCFRPHLAWMMAVRGGGIRTANACDPWALCTNFRKSCSLNRRGRGRLTAKLFEYTAIAARPVQLPGRLKLFGLILLGWCSLGWCSPPAVSQSADPSLVTAARSQSNLPPRVTQAQRFLARRGLASGHPVGVRVRPHANGLTPRALSTGVQAAWQPLGPPRVPS